jgi:hypothetical protein
MSIVSNHAPEVIAEVHGQLDETPRPRRPRKPQPKPERRIRLVHPVVYDVPGHVIVTVGKLSTDYTLERIGSPLGDASG